MIAIPGVTLTPLRVISTNGGPVLHMLRADNPHFTTFGEVYFSEVEPGCIKGWKRHTRQTQRFAVPVGQLRVVLHKDGVFMDVILGRPDHYALLHIPPGIWYAFGAIGDTPALLCNCADIPHDPEEGQKQDLASIHYDFAGQGRAGQGVTPAAGGDPLHPIGGERCAV